MSSKSQKMLPSPPKSHFFTALIKEIIKKILIKKVQNVLKMSEKIHFHLMIDLCVCYAFKANWKNVGIFLKINRYIFLTKLIPFLFYPVSFWWKSCFFYNFFLEKSSVNFFNTNPPVNQNITISINSYWWWWWHN